MRYNKIEIIIPVLVLIVLGGIFFSTQQLNPVEIEKKYSKMDEDQNLQMQNDLLHRLDSLDQYVLTPNLEKFGTIPKSVLKSLSDYNSEQQNLKDQNTAYYSISIDTIVFTHTNDPAFHPNREKFYYINPESDNDYVDAISWLSVKDNEWHTHAENNQYIFLKKALEVINFRGQAPDTTAPFSYFLLFNKNLVNPNFTYIRLKSIEKNGQKHFFLIQYFYRYGQQYVFIPYRPELKKQSDSLYLTWTALFIFLIIFSLIFFFYYFYRIKQLTTLNNRLATAHNKIQSQHTQLLENNIQLKKYLAALDHATCAIAIANTEGRIDYSNSIFLNWSKQESVVGKNVRDLSNLSPQRLNSLWNDMLLQSSQQDASYVSKLGQKTVVTNLALDRETNSVIIVDNDVSSLVNKYDDNLHILKNYIDGLRNINQFVLMGNTEHLDKQELIELIKTNVRGLEESINIYNNIRESLAASTIQEEMRKLYLPDIISRLVLKLEIAALSFNTKLEGQADDLSILGRSEDLELILSNLILNAMQAFKSFECPDPKVVVRVSKLPDNQCLIEVIDNGKPLKNYTDIESFAKQSTGLGINCILRKIQEMDGNCIGFDTSNPVQKSFKFTLPTIEI